MTYIAGKGVESAENVVLEMLIATLLYRKKGGACDRKCEISRSCRLCVGGLNADKSTLVFSFCFFMTFFNSEYLSQAAACGRIIYHKKKTETLTKSPKGTFCHYFKTRISVTTLQITTPRYKTQMADDEKKDTQFSSTRCKRTNRKKDNQQNFHTDRSKT